LAAELRGVRAAAPGRGHKASPHTCNDSGPRQNHHLANSSSAAGWSAFLRILSEKAACAGRSVVAVPPAHTRQTCAGGGREVGKGVSVRWPRCPYEDGGLSLHRDH